MTSLPTRARRVSPKARQGRGGLLSGFRVPTFPNVTQCQGPKCGPGLHVLALHGPDASDRLFSSVSHRLLQSTEQP